MKRIIMGMLLVVLLVTAACASRSEQSAPAPMPVPAPAPATSVFGKGVPAPVINIPSPAPAPRPGEVADSSGGVERMIVRTGDIWLVVEDITSTMEAIVRLTDNLGGYIVSSNSWEERGRLHGEISLRVPVTHFDSTLRELRDLAVDVSAESTVSKRD